MRLFKVVTQRTVTTTFYRVPAKSEESEARKWRGRAEFFNTAGCECEKGCCILETFEVVSIEETDELPPKRDCK